MLDALQEGLKELDELSKNDEFVECSINIKYMPLRGNTTVKNSGKSYSQ